MDFLTISGQKWLCGPAATGALVVADPERLRDRRAELLRPDAFEPDGGFTPRVGATRFDPGWIPAASLAGMLAALELQPDVGIRALG